MVFSSPPAFYAILILVYPILFAVEESQSWDTGDQRARGIWKRIDFNLEILAKSVWANSRKDFQKREQITESNFPGRLFSRFLSCPLWHMRRNENESHADSVIRSISGSARFPDSGPIYPFRILRDARNKKTKKRGARREETNFFNPPISDLKFDIHSRSLANWWNKSIRF